MTNDTPIKKFLHSDNPPNHLQLRSATVEDIAAIVVLVNSAYRGDSSRTGWTTEADLLGGQRTDNEEISRLISAPDSLLLLCMDGQSVIGSVHLEKLNAKTAYLGMLTVAPPLQGRGVGRWMMTEAERWACSEWDANTMQMQVIALRGELIAYYERRGYRRTEETRPFPDNPRFGLPKVAGLLLNVLEKSLKP